LIRLTHFNKNLKLYLHLLFISGFGRFIACLRFGIKSLVAKSKLGSKSAGMANSTSVPAILPCMEEVLSSSSKIIIRDMYSELQASVKLSDEDRDKAQMHLLERMLFEAGEDRTGHVALGFASHPVLQMGFTNAVRDAITPELAAIVNWRVLARLLPLAHKAPEDSITWRAMGKYCRSLRAKR